MLMVITSIILVFFVLMVGIFYLSLHALPDRFAHKKVQYQIVCVLGLIAMFTHMHIFWIAGLLLAMVDIPDFVAPLKRIAESTGKIASSQVERSNSSSPRTGAGAHDQSRAAAPASISDWQSKPLPQQ
ncbi:MAG: hypothetical protein K2Y27_13955 [Xanthobacteraceae bacterium]|nr:hypothetical protein [Xanthobacteraceae bacterium]